MSFTIVQNINLYKKFRIVLLFVLGANFLNAQNLSSSLTACYAFNNNGNEPINNLTATLGAVTATVDRFNNANSAYYCNGTNSSIIALPDNPLIRPTNEISVSVWIKPTILPPGAGCYVLYTKNTSSFNFEAYSITINNLGGGVSKFAALKGANGTSNVCLSTTSIVANSWYHVVMSIDNTSIKIYINGNLENTVNATVSFSYDPNHNVYFGGTNESYNLPFTGIVDNARFYNRVITSTEVGLLYTTDPVCAIMNSVTVPTIANFTSPDTVCIGQTFTLQNTSTGTISSTYWNACSSTVIASPSATNLGNPGSSLNNPVFMSINKDGNTYYKFVTNNANGTISRINYGSNLNNNPLSTTIIASGLSGIEGIHIEKEGSNWYGIVVGGFSPSYVARLNFGTSLSNTPTITNMGNIGGLNFPGSLLIFRENSNYYGLTTNYTDSTLTRFSFGSSLSNIPGGINLGNIGSMSGPRQMAAIYFNSGWHAFVCNDVNNSLTRLSFGNSLNNTPSGTNIGNPNSLLNIPRGLSISADCNSIKGLIANAGNNSLMTMDFPSGPTGTITLNSLGNIGSLNYPTSILKYMVGDSTVYYLTNALSNSITRLDYAKCNSIPSSTLQNPVMTFTAAGNYTISLESNEGLYDQSKYCKVINVSPIPTISASSNPNVLCKGGTATLSALGAQAYTWQPGNLAGLSVNVSPTISTTYTIYGSNTNGCASTSTLNLVVSPTINISASSNPVSVCPGNSATLSATGAGSYTWSPGNLIGFSVVVNPFSATIYTVTGTLGGCSATATAVVNMGQVLNMSVSGNLCNNTNVDLYVSPTSNSTTILWSGPGIISANNTSTISVNVGGTYSVTVTNTITNCSGTATIFVTSSLSPLSFSVVPSATEACFPGPPVNMLVNLSANLSWLPAVEVTPNSGPLVSVSPSVTSTYSVYATLGSCTGSAAITISVNPTPTVVTSITQATACSLSPVKVSASGANQFNWMPGNLVGDTVSLLPYSSSIFTVSGSIGHCTTTQTINITVLPTPSVSAFASPKTICIGNTSTLSASGALTYTWQSLNLSVPFASVIVSPTITSTYSVSGTNSLGCSSTYTLQLTVINSPAIDANSSNSIICAGESVTLSASGAASYTWLPGFISGSTIVTSPTTSVTYTVNSNNFNCNYATVIVIVLNCVNTSLGLTNHASVPVPSALSYYKIKFTITAGNSSDSDLTEVSLTDDLRTTFPYPASYTITGKPRITSVNSSLVLNPNYDGLTETMLTQVPASTLPPNKRDTISFDLLLKPDGFKGIAKNSVIGTALNKYNILGSDSSNNGFLWDPDLDGDPTNNNQITEIEINGLELFIPEGFSPNNDGNNDKFMIGGLNGKSISLTVYNRWGNKVYENSDYDNSWDGTPNSGGLKFGDGKLPEATYYYVIEFSDGANASVTGFVVLKY